MVEVVLYRVFYEFVTSCFLFSFYSPYVILLRIVLLIPLKSHTGNRSCRLLQYNIITTKPIGPYLPLSRGRKESDLVGVWIVWNLEPLASGGQSSPKLIPHIICPFLYAWEKNSERGLILEGIKCQPAPSSHVRKLKSRFGILVDLPSHKHQTVICYHPTLVLGKK